MRLADAHGNLVTAAAAEPVALYDATLSASSASARIPAIC